VKSDFVAVIKKIARTGGEKDWRWPEGRCVKIRRSGWSPPPTRGERSSIGERPRKPKTGLQTVALKRLATICPKKCRLIGGNWKRKASALVQNTT